MADSLTSGSTQQHWTQSGGDFSILGGSSLISHCQPHFHETYVIAYMRGGQSELFFRNHLGMWQTGEIFLCNPYELQSGSSTGGDLLYDVCYPSQSFMNEVLNWAKDGKDAFPRLSAKALHGEAVVELSEILSNLTTASQEDRACATAEERLIQFIRRHRSMIVEPAQCDDISWVSRVHDELDQSDDGYIGVSALADRLHCDRSYLTRVFRRTTGLPLSSYVRQLRLARALESIRHGVPLADSAAMAGFADQAHLTREFKRIYGTTPGKLVRDIFH